jgi:hypothetical protein
MKNTSHLLFFMLAFILSAYTVNAQMGAIIVSGGLGGSKLSGELGKNGSLGINYLLEGTYFLKDNLAVGLTYDASIIGYKNEGSALGISAYTPVLWQAKVDYYWGSKKIKPYVSFGLGLAKVATPEIQFLDAQGNVTGAIPAEKKWNLAFSPRMGLLLGKHWGLEWAFNVAGKTPMTQYQNVTSGNKSFNFSTFALKYAYKFYDNRK